MSSLAMRHAGAIIEISRNKYFSNTLTFKFGGAGGLLIYSTLISLNSLNLDNISVFLG